MIDGETEKFGPNGLTSASTVFQFQGTKANSTTLTGWRVSVSDILMTVRHNNQSLIARFGNYSFRVRPSYTISRAISMSQNISLDAFTLLISVGIAHYSASVDFWCWGNQFGYIQLIFFDLNGLSYSAIYQGKI